MRRLAIQLNSDLLRGNIVNNFKNFGKKIRQSTQVQESEKPEKAKRQQAKSEMGFFGKLNPRNWRLRRPKDRSGQTTLDKSLESLQPQKREQESAQEVVGKCMKLESKSGDKYAVSDENSEIIGSPSEENERPAHKVSDHITTECNNPGVLPFGYLLNKRTRESMVSIRSPSAANKEVVPQSESLNKPSAQINFRTSGNNSSGDVISDSSPVDRIYVESTSQMDCAQILETIPEKTELRENEKKHKKEKRRPWLFSRKARKSPKRQSTESHSNNAKETFQFVASIDDDLNIIVKLQKKKIQTKNKTPRKLFPCWHWCRSANTNKGNAEIKGEEYCSISEDSDIISIGNSSCPVPIPTDSVSPESTPLDLHSVLNHIPPELTSLDPIKQTSLYSSPIDLPPRECIPPNVTIHPFKSAPHESVLLHLISLYTTLFHLPMVVASLRCLYTNESEITLAFNPLQLLQVYNMNPITIASANLEDNHQVCVPLSLTNDISTPLSHGSCVSSDDTSSLIQSVPSSMCLIPYNPYSYSNNRRTIYPSKLRRNAQDENYFRIKRSTAIRQSRKVGPDPVVRWVHPSWEVGSVNPRKRKLSDDFYEGLIKKGRAGAPLVARRRLPKSKETDQYSDTRTRLVTLCNLLNITSNPPKPKQQ